MLLESTKYGDKRSSPKPDCKAKTEALIILTHLLVLKKNMQSIFWVYLIPWTARRSKQSILKEISPGCSLEGMMLKLKLQLLWPPHAKSWLTGKDSDAGRDWGQEGKGTTGDEMTGWHHCLDGCESEWTPGVGDGQGDLACCDSWGRKESDTTERLNWTELNLCYTQSVSWFTYTHQNLNSSYLCSGWGYKSFFCLLKSTLSKYNLHEIKVTRLKRTGW